MKAYKGFNIDMTCHGFQYEIGKTYETDKAELPYMGFYACENPTDCFKYNTPNQSLYCEVEIEDNGQRDKYCSKVVGTKITIGAQIGIKELVAASLDYTKEVLRKVESDYCGGDSSALNAEFSSVLKSGDCSTLNGGAWSALSSGDNSALNATAWSLLSSGNRSVMNGGDGSSITGGERCVLYGGNGSKLKAKKYSVLAFQHWQDGNFKCIKFAEVDGKHIKEDRFYTLLNGEIVECE
ncbi:hypothetical protein HBP70_13715 [Listeria welshimeri]|nr:hypothetical protein [Listeria welshimeri]